MKVYVLEYDLEIIKANSLSSATEHRKQSYLDIAEFIQDVKEKQDKWYISNIKCHSGEVKEIDINKVLNPF